MLRRSLLASGATLPLIGTARAQQTWPTRPIRLVVGYSPGGGNDLIARIVAAKMQDKLGQPVVVDNKPGAQSIVAAELVAKSPADGYTLLVAPTGPMTINPAVYSKLPYDPLRDFAPVAFSTATPARCGALPIAVTAKSILVFCDSATSSFRLLAGTDGCTTSR